MRTAHSSAERFAEELGDWFFIGEFRTTRRFALQSLLHAVT